MSSGERITTATAPERRVGHEDRYRLAAEHLRSGDVVLDAACGSGYGSAILSATQEIGYVGVDRDLSDLEIEPNDLTQFIQADLRYWVPDFSFDVFIGFETAEHLNTVGHYLGIAKQARRTIFLSVPVVPTVGQNPWHLLDFAPGELPTLVEDESWKLVRTVEQRSEVAEVYQFERRA